MKKIIEVVKEMERYGVNPENIDLEIAMLEQELADYFHEVGVSSGEKNFAVL